MPEITIPTGLKFQREKAHDFIPKHADLFALHWGEVGHFRDIPLDPDFEKYKKLEEIGNLRIYSVTDQDDETIGYCFFVLGNNLHYRKSLQANQDIIFIHPERRGFGKTFINWCDNELRKEGIQVVFQHVKAKKELNFSPLLEKLNYELMDLIYARRLDKGE